jgi:hypothetical protein
MRKEVAEKCPESRFDISDAEFSGSITESQFVHRREQTTSPLHGPVG